MDLAREMTNAVKLHAVTFARVESRARALDLLVRWVHENRATSKFAANVGARLAEVGGADGLLWLAAWAGCGFPQIVLGHKLAASLMATRVAPQACEGLDPPWSAYRVIVPGGLVVVPDLHASGAPLGMDLLSVSHDPDRCFVFGQSRSASPFTLVCHRSSLAEGLENEGSAILSVQNAGEGAFDMEQVHARALDLLWRLVVGVEMEMTDASRVAGPGGGGRADSPRVGVEPAVRTFQFTRKVVVDCRDAIREHLVGRRSGAPAVQSLVRGHWKRQRVGVGGADRVWIHIEPYWRGPEDAPIAVRPHELRGGS